MGKLYYISTSRIPTEKAHGIQIMQTCAAFAAQEVDVELLVPSRRNKRFAATDAFEFYGIKKQHTLTRLACIDPRFMLGLPGGVYIKTLALLFGLKLQRYLRAKVKPDDVLYTRDTFLLPFLVGLGGKVVWEAHDMPSHATRYIRYWQQCYRIITISQSLRAAVCEHGIYKSAVLVAPDGVELARFSAETQDKQMLRAELDLPTDKSVVMYAGHLYDWKGVQVLADAAWLLPESYQVVFVGGTDEDQARFAKQNETNQRITLVGHKSPQEIPAFLKAADVLVLPNSAKQKISTHYTSPLKLFEYMASGVPIVASDLQSIREIVDEQMVFFAEPDNPDSLAAVIQMSATDSIEAKQRAQRSLDEVKKYDWDNRAKKILAHVS